MKTHIYKASFQSSADKPITKAQVAGALRALADMLENHPAPHETDSHLPDYARFIIAGHAYPYSLHERGAIEIEFLPTK